VPVTWPAFANVDASYTDIEYGIERKANQPTGNGQYRIVGDHLGSTSLVVDSANPPAVVHRQYFKPYGEFLQMGRLWLGAVLMVQFICGNYLLE
jgi:hypothetical protein